MSDIINKSVFCSICIAGAYSIYTICKCLLKRNKKDLYLLNIIFFSQIPPPGTSDLDGTSCWKCEGRGYRYNLKYLKI